MTNSSTNFGPYTDPGGGGFDSISLGPINFGPYTAPGGGPTYGRACRHLRLSA